MTPLPPASAAPWDVHVVAHTHWDREWYHAASRFRQRLVALMDALLEHPGDGTPFLLDGQAITLRDYLAVRPEAAPRLGEALRNGALEAGPWFVLADALIPGGEALIRNLEAGRRELARHGAAPPAVAYCPDSFGHPAALPAIAQGFGLPVAVVWRGMGGPRHPRAAAVRWRAPDGSSVVAWHLPPDGYEIGATLPDAPHDAQARWLRLGPVIADRHLQGPWLLLNGADHHARQPALEAAIAALAAAAAPGAVVRRGTLQGFARALEAHARAVALPEVAGELRDSYGYTWTLGGTLATRAHQKRRNARLERLLLRDVEPWGALAWCHAPAEARRVANDGRLTLAQWPALLAAAWETLLATHPHDTLCGCSTDTVARAMDARQDAVAAQARGLRTEALALALGHDPVAARRQPPPCDAAVLLRNRTAAPRGGLARVTLVHTVADAPAGPASAGAPAVPWDRATPLPLPERWLVQPESGGMAFHRRESSQHYPDNDLVRVRRMLAWVPEVPAFGVRLLAGPPAEVPPPPPAVRAIRVPASDGAPSRWCLEHDRLRVEVREGCVCVEVRDPEAPRRLEDALWLESQDDAGDSYTPSPRGAPQRLTLVRATLGARGPLRAAVRLHWRLPGGDPDPIPSALEDAAPRRAGARRRGGVRAVTELAVEVGSPLLRCRVVVRNRRRNHRLRLVWGVDVHGGPVVADAALGPVEREPVAPPPHAREAVPDGMPLHRWVSTAAGHRGAALFSDGLAEAMVAPGRLGVTLLRAVGELSRATLPERPGHAGWPCATPLAQAQGRYGALVALWLHGPHTPALWPELARLAEDLLVPLEGTPWRDPLPPGAEPTGMTLAGPELVGHGLEFSTVTVAHDGEALVLRAVNLLDAPVTGAWRLPGRARADGQGAGALWVTPCRLDGTPTGETVPLRDGRYPFVAPPRGVVTVRVTRAPRR
ncbi:MAG: hypothetical protein KJT01_04690 [Gemmatimonadetes bacterium]|nr:hypothetical protein [Gemmatimonadota bacterium]